MNINKQQKGFTLVELMIALLLSLIVTYGIAQVLITSNQSSASSDGVSQAQETARFVMSFLGRQIRSAGLDSITDDDNNTQAVMGCDIAALSNVLPVPACSANSNAGATEATITVAAGAISGDVLAIAWIPPDGVTTDCTGATIIGFTPGDTIVNVFGVGFDAASGTNSLICQGHLFDGVNVTSGTALAIANGVEAMHVLYGEATDPLPANGARNISRYVDADNVADWERVYAIKIAIMTRSLSDITNEVATKQYVMLDSGLYSFNDAVNRQVFSSTFTLSNYRD